MEHSSRRAEQHLLTLKLPKPQQHPQPSGEWCPAHFLGNLRGSRVKQKEAERGRGRQREAERERGRQREAEGGRGRLMEAERGRERQKEA